MFNNSEYRDNDNIDTSSTESGSTESGFSDSFSDRLSYNRSYYSENSNSIINIISSKYKLLIPEIFN